MNDLNEIVEALRTNKKVRPMTVRIFIGLFNAKRRGRSVITGIRE